MAARRSSVEARHGGMLHWAVLPRRSVTGGRRRAAAGLPGTGGGRRICRPHGAHFSSVRRRSDGLLPNHGGMCKCSPPGMPGPFVAGGVVSVQNRTAYSGGEVPARVDMDAQLTVELASVISAARRRATRDGDRQVDTAHLLHGLLEWDPAVRDAFDGGPPQIARLLGYLVQRSIGYGLQWHGTVEDSGAVPMVAEGAYRDGRPPRPQPWTVPSTARTPATPSVRVAWICWPPWWMIPSPVPSRCCAAPPSTPRDSRPAWMGTPPTWGDGQLTAAPWSGDERSR